MKAVLLLLLTGVGCLAAPPEFSKKQFHFSFLPGATVAVPLLPLFKTYDKTKTIYWRTSRLPENIRLEGKTANIRGIAPEKVGILGIAIEARQGDETARTDIFIHTQEKPKANASFRKAGPTSGGAPIWFVEPLQLTAKAGQKFERDLKAEDVADPENDPLTFKFKADIPAPAWLELSADGWLRGTPTQGKNYSFVVEVSDGTSVTQGPVFLKVTDDNDAPVINAANLVFDVDERGTRRVNLADPAYVTDDSPRLFFKFPTPSEWATLSEAGELVLSPRYPAVGDQTLAFEVSDGLLTSNGTIRVKVREIPQAPEWVNPTLRYSASEGVALNQSVAAKALDKDGRRLTFSRVSGDAWLDVSSSGAVRGTPPSSGDHQFTVRASNGTLHADVSLTIAVIRGNRAPQWTGATIRLANARAGTRYKETLVPHATDPEGDEVEFSLRAGPNWAKVVDGFVSGIPAVADAGPTPARIRVRASDPQGLFTDATVEVVIEKPNTRPRWIGEQPIALGAGELGKEYVVNLANLAKDDEGQKLFFSKVAGPDWLVVEADGMTSGTPTAMGEFPAVLQVSDGEKSAQGAFVGRITPANNPPVIDPISLRIEERRVLTFKLTDFVHDADPGDKLAFSMTPPSWVTLTKEGELTLRPGFDQVGPNVLDFEVSDGRTVVPGKIHVTVQRVARPPRWKEEGPLKFSATAGTKFEATLAGKAEDRDGLKVTFSRKPEGPDWLTVEPDGRMHGTPGDEHADKNEFVVTASNDRLGADIALHIQVNSDNSRPEWTRNPVVLPGGKSGKTYAQSVAAFAMDRDPDEELTFEPVKDAAGNALIPKWAHVLPHGLIFGVPEEGDASVNILNIRVRDSRKAYADAKVHIPIDSKNNPPEWLVQPIPLGSARVGQRFEFNLAQAKYVRDLDGDALEFSRVSGPAWLHVEKDGTVWGTPQAGDAVQFPAVFQVTDKKAFSQVDAFGEVQGGNKIPIVKEGALSFNAVPGQRVEFNLADPKYVEDPDPTHQTRLTFEELSSLSWASLSQQGRLTLAPTASHLGSSSLAFKVTDPEGASAEGVISITVADQATEPPQWLVEPVILDLLTDTDLTGDLKDSVVDKGGRELKFTRISGVDWVTVQENGRLSGRTASVMVGIPQILEVRASNGSKHADGKVIINVRATTASGKDTFVFHEKEKDAPIDLLFVLDHSSPSSTYYQQLKDNSRRFFSTLDEAHVRYSTAVLSSRNFNGRPVTDSRGESRLTYLDENLWDEFKRLVDRTYAGNTLQSPTWALDQFFANIKSQPKLYKNEYYLPEVPLMVFVHTRSRDDFRTLAQGTTAQNLGFSDAGYSFVQFHRDIQKPFSIYVNDMTCNSSFNLDFLQLVASGHGAVMTSKPCIAPHGDLMQYFAREVIAQSARYDKKYFELSKTPASVAKIKVTMRHADKTSYPLTGNTGLSTDQWHYDVKKNWVILHWWNIRLPYKPETDKLIVEY